MQLPSSVQDRFVPTSYATAPSKLLFNSAMPFTLFVLAHFALGFILRQVPSLGTVHAYATVLLGVLWALSKPPLFTAYLTAYIVGAEVLWRMTEASVFYETGKYAIVLVMVLSLLRQRNRYIPVAPLLYFVLLLPSIILTIFGTDISRARELISFNLSGPLALFVSAWFFSKLQMSVNQLIRLLFMLLAPLVTIASYSILRTLTSAEIHWVNDSMFTTSGGFGPNQVSTVMGLGMFTICAILAIWKRPRPVKWLLIIVGMIFFAQGLLTFSRGGMIASVITIGFVLLHTISGTRKKGQLLTLLSVGILLVTFMILPILNEFTNGFLEQRFSDPSLSQRDIIILEEIRLFEGSPIAGIGPGMGTEIRGAAAHTEMTRLLAEHGMLGLMSLGIILLSVLRRYRALNSLPLRGLSGGGMLWSLLVMTNAAMRIAAISFMFGLAFVEIDVYDRE